VTTIDLSDERLLLRAPTVADADAMTEALQDPEIPRWIAAIPTPYSLADALHFVTEVAEPGWESGDDRMWLVTDLESERLLGGIGLHARLAGVGEVGFWLAPWARGRGVMTDALGLVCAFAFDVLGLQRVEWQAVVGNQASRRVAERAGFVVEGTLRGRLLQRDGTGADAWIAGVVAGDLPGVA
jgi:RimJ/RimL family protein N-acetyltransferase